jgi:hypothetical protein
MSKQEQEVKRLLTALRPEGSEGLTAKAIRRQALAAHKGTAESEILAEIEAFEHLSDIEKEELFGRCDNPLKAIGLFLGGCWRDSNY